MTKTIFTTALFLLLSAASFAGNNGNKKTNLFRDLSAALQHTQQATYTATAMFNSTYFMYNGKAIHAFYDNSNGNLIGFSIPLQAKELPAGAQENIEKKYKGCQLSEAIMFVDNNGNSGYYVSVTSSNKPTLVLKLNANNNPVIYTTM